ncbi:MAG TPA: polynucleotide adenylyltransferase PcnB [Nevskiaceae bacterium]|nr:polynucleotide adenylyltransferase PcnB [Nevskiaceae bacterium]
MIEPLRIARADHCVSRKDISRGALNVLYTLRDAGHEAYLVGGGVRDLLMGLKPKDFDISTSARPEQVRALFRWARLVGRRFVITHVRMGGEIMEVTTFRGALTASQERDETGRILSDNIYGDLESDALRRDFTVNALYYDVGDFSIIDYAGGMEDLHAGRLRLIGDPDLRYREDPVRMLRAVRIGAKLGFAVDAASGEPIRRLAPLLGEVPAARLFDEVLKLFLNHDAVANLRGLRDYGLFAVLFPDTARAVAQDDGWSQLVEHALANTAERVTDGRPVTPAFLYAALLWPVVANRAAHLATAEAYPPLTALSQAADEAIAHQVQHTSLPRRFSIPMREIWLLQPRFDNRRGARVQRLLAHPRFRAAYDFLCLRAATGEPELRALADWWTVAQERTPSVGTTSAAELADGIDGASTNAESATVPAPQRRRRRRGGRRHAAPESSPTAGD